MEYPVRIADPLDETLPTPEQYVKQGFHVTNLCKFYINGGCYNENCQFAHSKEEMDAYSAEHNPFWRTRKCRAFHNNKFCEYGSACLYKHELQGCKRKRRHFYITNLPTASYVYSEMSETEPTEETCLSGASRLPIFAEIHAQDDAESMDEQAEDSDCDFKPQQSSDDEASADTDLDSN